MALTLKKWVCMVCMWHTVVGVCVMGMPPPLYGEKDRAFPEWGHIPRLHAMRTCSLPHSKSPTVSLPSWWVTP